MSDAAPTVIQGHCDPAFDAVREGLAKGFPDDEHGAACAVTLDGELVVDLWAGFRDGDRTLPWERDTLAKSKAASVTVFAFDESQELSEHTVPHDALVFLLEGEAEISIAGQPHRLQQGDLLRMPANRPHAVKATNRFKMLLTMIRSL